MYFSIFKNELDSMVTEQQTILLVEDEVFIAMAQEKKLSQFGYNVITACSGEEAVALACGDTSIDLILMDIDLGRGIDGTEAARQILDCIHIPIVFLTSHAEREMVEKVRGITRYGYIIKNSGEFVLRSSIEMAFELHGAKNIFRDTFTYSINGLCIHRMLYNVDGSPRDCLYIDVNDAFENHTGLSKQDVIGHTILDLYSEDEAREIIQLYYQVVDSRKPMQVDHYFAPINSFFNLCIFPMSGDDFTVAIQNITEQRRSEELLRKSEEKYRNITELSPNLIAIHSDNKFLYINNAGAKMLGCDDSESIIGKSLTDFLPQNRHEIAKQRIQSAYDSVNSTSIYRQKIQRIDGSLLDIEVYGIPIVYNGEKAIQIIAHDISDQIKVEKQEAGQCSQRCAAFTSLEDE